MKRTKGRTPQNKLDHAKNMLAKAERRVRIAMAKVRLWQRRATYYGKVVALGAPPSSKRGKARAEAQEYATQTAARRKLEIE